MIITKLRRNAKALSPIFAVLILIAIAVIAGIVIYMFTSGFLSTGAPNQGITEEVTVQSASYDGLTTVTALAQSTGGPVATINGMIVHDSSGNVAGQDLAVSQLLSATALTQVSGTITLGTGTYTVTLTSVGGGSYVSPAFSVP